MNKRSVFSFTVIFLLIMAVSVWFAYGVGFNAGLNIDSVDEDTSTLLNFTINNTDNNTNITLVNITLPNTNFSFIAGTNGTSVTGASFSNTSVVLTWNKTFLIENGSSQNFWFNITASQPGTYNFTVTILDNNSVSNSTNINITINDTTSPVITLNYPSDSSTEISTSPTLNITVTDVDGDNMSVSFHEYIPQENWTMFHNDLSNSGYIANSYFENISIQFANTSFGGFMISSGSAVANGYVYIGSYDYNIYQLNASNISQQIANYTTGGEIKSSTPAVANGYVYIGSYDDHVYQLNASNISQQIANYTTLGDVDCSPAATEDFVYVSSADNLYQLNASDISQQIANYSITNTYSSPAVANGYVYIGSTDSHIYQLNASDISQQIANFTTSGAIYCSPASTAEYVYIGDANGLVYQLNASDISQQISNFTTTNFIWSSPAVANGYLYVGDEGCFLFQLNASNISQEISNYSCTPGNWIDSSPAVTDKYVYFGSQDNHFYQLNALDVSQQIANFTMGNDVDSSPTVANGYVYVGCDHYATFYQLGTGGLLWEEEDVVNGSDVTYTWSGLSLETTYNWFVEATDGTNLNTSSIWDFTTQNLIPVIISISTSNVDTDSAVLNVITEETAICRYSSADLDYTNMTNNFTVTNSTIHTSDLTGLSDDTSYTYYVRCNSSAGNVMSYSNSTAFTTDSESSGDDDDDDDSSSISNNVDRTLGKLIYNRSFTLKLNDYRKFRINGIDHKITLTLLTNESAVFKIESESINVNLAINETNYLDINDDNKNDILLKLDKIYFNSLSAYITIGPYNETEEISEEENLTQEPEENITGAIEEEINITGGENDTLNITTAAGESASGNKWLATLVVIIILIMAGIVSVNVIHTIKEKRK